MLHSTTPPLSWPTTPISLDLLVTAGGTPIPCNKAALCSGSAYFSAKLFETSNNIDLPGVPADMFTKLLGCLYTGKLDCTIETVYQLFWYAQMLQMPNAVLQCSQFLSQLSAPIITATTTGTPFSSAPPSPPPQTVEPTPPSPKPKVIKPIPSRGIPLLPVSSEFSPSLLRPHLASFYSDWFMRYSTLTRNSCHKQEERSIPGTSHEGDDNITNAVVSQQQTSTIFSTEAAILETAACDGPVKFHRIINKYFTAIDLPKDPDPKENDDDAKEDEFDEATENDETYSCIYCNHVFKSHYCYQKHKRRHINPVTVDIQGNDQDKKFLVMKDLNVQYFPCKICGAKFPSYYFVHKHKKLWHRAQLELEQELEKQQEKSNQDVKKQD